MNGGCLRPVTMEKWEKRGDKVFAHIHFKANPVGADTG